mmetsp:Transcript_2513/g.6924  ORF Transcript_2513/g.6924 Transcript_2513/m.6924 type:complete len:208 (+) Transcript_2513:36-659(+)
MYNIASDPIQQNSLLLESSLRTNDEPGQVAGALVILSLHKFPPRPKADACLEDKLRGVDGHVNPAAQGESNPTFSCYWRQKGEDLFLGGLGPEAPTLGRVVKLETEFHSPEFRPHLFVLRRKPPARQSERTRSGQSIRKRERDKVAWSGTRSVAGPLTPSFPSPSPGPIPVPGGPLSTPAGRDLSRTSSHPLPRPWRRPTRPCQRSA